jgi:hypothetical protein
MMERFEWRKFLPNLRLRNPAAPDDQKQCTLEMSSEAKKKKEAFPPAPHKMLKAKTANAEARRMCSVKKHARIPRNAMLGFYVSKTIHNNNAQYIL